MKNNIPNNDNNTDDNISNNSSLNEDDISNYNDICSDDESVAQDLATIIKTEANNQNMSMLNSRGNN